MLDQAFKIEQNNTNNNSNNNLMNEVDNINSLKSDNIEMAAIIKSLEDELQETNTKLSTISAQLHKVQQQKDSLKRDLTKKEKMLE